MYAFVKVMGGVGRAFEKHCEDLGVSPSDHIAAMIEGFVASKNMPLPPKPDHGEGVLKLTNLYVEMRSTKAALNKAAETECDAIKEKMEQIEGHLLSILNSNGVKSMNVGPQLFYKEKDIKPSIGDDTALFDFIAEQHKAGEDGFRFLERRVTKTAVAAWMEEHGKAPPGVNVLTEYKVIVRKGKNTK